MSKKDRLLSILEHSQQVLGAFVAGLSAEERAAVGTYEQWCPKDSVAHVAYWIEQRAARLAAVARGEEPPPLPAHYEQANAACFQRFCNCPWPEVQAYMDAAYTQLLAVVRSLGEEVLTAPSADAHERPLWTDIVATAYTHPAMHVAEQYARQGKPQAAAQLWQEWSRLVSPLDDSAEWQGLVHYNTACSLALSGNAQQAIAELRQALQLRPQLKAWSKQDTDLNSLHDLPEYRKLYAAEYWWKALDAGPLAEALADQFLRALAMFREAVAAFPADEWRKGDTPYQRPAGLALHVVDSLDGYCALRPGEAGTSPRFAVTWEEKDSAKLPVQDELLAYLDEVEPKLTRFLTEGDLTSAETLFRWTGSTLLGRAAYNLRHLQHHLAEMCLELHRRGLTAPEWQ